MKTIGLLGGMSWESTVTYYQVINQQVKTRLGGLHCAKIVLQSVDFHEIEQMMNAGHWGGIGDYLSALARSLEAAGAEILVLCTNTIHKVAPRIEASISIPFLHIADATANEIKRTGLDVVGLLGTKVTMEEEFLVERFRSHGISILIPRPAERDIVHQVIFDELCLGKINEISREAYAQIIARMAAQGAQGVILGCTEIGSLINQAASPLPLFDTTILHAQMAVDMALAQEW
ncbi:MAG TPA: aspartate/glutamate racemase family protein [Desulfonatronum sp.]|nr:aspartate/glutamate racemase family protein [Desulfonatronum sp.]